MRAVVFADTTHVRCGDVHRPGMKDALRLTHALSFCVTTLVGSSVLYTTSAAWNVAIVSGSTPSSCGMVPATPGLPQSFRFPPGYSSATAACPLPSAHAVPDR